MLLFISNSYFLLCINWYERADFFIWVNFIAISWVPKTLIEFVFRNSKSVFQWHRDRGEESERLANYGNIVCSHQRCKNHLGMVLKITSQPAAIPLLVFGRWSVLQANDCKVIQRESLSLSFARSLLLSARPTTWAPFPIILFGGTMLRRRYPP